MIAPLDPPTDSVQASQRVDEAIRDQSVYKFSGSSPGYGKVDALQRQIVELAARNPLAAVAVAAGVGLALGWITKRRGR